VSILCLALGHYLLSARHSGLGSEARFPRQVLLFTLTTIAVICLVIAVPLAEGTSTSVLSHIGLGFFAVIAFSSTSFVTHFMAAITLRVTKPFNVGDVVTVGKHFDKVSERGPFDTDIQTDSRELIFIPNSVLILSPITVARGAGVIVSGLLMEVKTLLTCRSRLNACVLDSLHDHGLGIVSPTTARRITVSNGSAQTLLLRHEKALAILANRPEKRRLLADLLERCLALHLFPGRLAWMTQKPLKRHFQALPRMSNAIATQP